MLIENLYTVDSFKTGAGKTNAIITINAAHKIFDGHFPGQPVLPGVCQLQIVKELLEKSVEKKLFLTEAAQCKFLQMVVPTQTPVLNISFEYKIEKNLVAVNAVIKGEDVVFLKMSGTFVIVE